MATPVNDSYSAPSGGVIAGGRYHGVPAPGKIANINLNTAFSVDPDGGVSTPWQWYNGYYGTNSLRAMFGGWNGAVWCPQYSTHGAIAWYGGGHGANIGNFATVFDLKDKTWRVVGTQNLGGDGLWQSDGSADAAWKDFQLGASRIYKLNHQYRSICYVPPGYDGVGSKGALYMPLTQDLSADPAGIVFGPHLLDLDTGVVTRCISNLGAFSGTAGSGNALTMFDAENGKAWTFLNGSGVGWYVDFNESAPRLLRSHTLAKDVGASSALWSYTATPCYVPDNQMGVMLYGTGTNGGALTLQMIDFSSGMPVIVKATIPAGVDTRGGVNGALSWDSEHQKFYFYEGAGDEFCLTLTPSSLNFRTCTWAWGVETFDGTAAYRGLFSSDTRSFGRMVYAPVLKSLVWCDGPDTSGVCIDGQTRTGLVQAWRTPGGIT